MRATTVQSADPSQAGGIEANGYAILEGVFDSSEMEALCKDIAGAHLARTRAGARHAMRIPPVFALAYDERLIAIARSALGVGATPYRATFFEKSVSANWLVVWHQDTALPLQHRSDKTGWGPWSVKAGIVYAHAPADALQRVLALRVHLDDSTAFNGPLRVLPGTHQRGVLTDEAVQGIARKAEQVECLVSRGGVVAMRPLLIHASSKSQNDLPRRVLHIEYASSLGIDSGLELALA